MLMSVVLAAGKGTRMVSEQPKVLHPLLGMPLLEHMLVKVDELRPTTSVAVVGYRKDSIIQQFSDRGLVWGHQDEQLGTGHAASIGVEAGVAAAGPAGDVLILNGDLPLLTRETLKQLVETHASTGAAVTVLTCEKEDPFSYGRIVRDATTGRLKGIVEEKDADEATRRIKETNAGVYVFKIDVFREYYARTDCENVQGEYYLTDVVALAADDGRTVETVAARTESEIEQVNSRQELAVASRLLRQDILRQLLDSGVTIVDPALVYVEMDVRIGVDTTIYPFTYLHRGVEIGSGCDIGPFARLRPGTCVADNVRVGNFVEIKSSEVESGAKIGHLAYVGDAFVGENVNVGAGTVFANYDGKKKSRTVVEEGAFIGSGTILVAPVSVGRGAVTGAGTVVTKGKDVADGAVVVGVPGRELRPSSGASKAERPEVSK